MCVRVIRYIHKKIVSILNDKKFVKLFKSMCHGGQSIL